MKILDNTTGMWSSFTNDVFSNIVNSLDAQIRTQIIKVELSSDNDE